VNLYVPSQLTWTEGSAKCTLTQETNYPTENLIKLRVETSTPTQFALHLRIPAWAGKRTSVSVNGKRMLTEAPPGSFFAVGRTWRSGDLVELEIDQAVRTQPVDQQTPDQVAIMRGSQVLFAISEAQPKLTRAQLEKPVLARAGANDWHLGDLLLRPFPYIGDEVYQTYSKVVS
jgi:DUF1680 family protein